MPNLAAREWIVSPSISLTTFTGDSLSEWWTDTLASVWVTDVSWQQALGTLCSQTVHSQPRVYTVSGAVGGVRLTINRSWVHSRSGRYKVVTTWMGDCLWIGKPSRYITNLPSTSTQPSIPLG